MSDGEDDYHDSAGTNSGGYRPNQSRASEVVVKDIEMSFFSMVRFMVKWTLASIPAVIILSFIGFLLMLFFATVVPSFQDFTSRENLERAKAQHQGKPLAEDQNR